MKSFFIALQFLSRIQLVKQTVWTNEDFGRAVLFFPLVGWIIGILLAVIYAGCSYIFEEPYRSLLVVLSWFFITGGLHADGFMDTADGVFSGRSRERMLEILKDSCVGANGVMAFFVLASLKICFLAHCSADMALAALTGIPAAARFGTLISIFQFPYARAQGLGKAFRQYAPAYTTKGAFILAMLPTIYGGFLYVFLLGAAMLTALLVNHWLTNVLGGVTGDTYGAVLEGSELILLGLTCLLSMASVHIGGFSL